MNVRGLTAAAAALALVTACSSSSTSHVTAPSTTGASPGSSVSASGSPSAASATALARFYHQKLAWRGCGGGFSCASLLVPLDYAKPSGPTLRVAVIRQRSTGSHRGSLIVNPGGPGGSGVQFVRQAAFAFDGVTRHLDLVGFDPRGVGASKPIRCLTTAQLDAYFHLDLEATAGAARTRLVNLSRGFADGCWRRNGAYLSHVGTIDAARDMDVLRAALGDRKLTYYGASYGTYLGAKYAQLFPTHIRAMVLDGAVNPAFNTVADDIDQSKGFETNLDDFIAWCTRHGSCPLGASKATAMRNLGRLVARLRADPERVGSRLLGVGEFWAGLAEGFYDTSEWPGLRTALAQARRGNGAGMLQYFDALVDRRPDGSYDNLMESNMAINCVDRESPTSLAGFDAARQQAVAASPHFGIAILYSSLPCAYWHVSPVERAHPVQARTASPIMVIGTTHDPATPYANAVAFTHQLGPPAFLVTLVGDGHTAYFRGNDCISGLVDPYLTSARVPRGSPRCG